MRRFWEQLTKSQKKMVIAAASFVIAALLVQFAAFPYFDARQKTKRAIAVSEKVLKDLKVLGAEYAVLRQRSEEIRRLIERRPPGFALFSYLEKKAGDAGVKTNIKSINPLKSEAAEAYEEASVEIRLERLTMKQLTDFLYMVVSREDMVRVRKMTVVKMKENPEYLSAQFQVFTYQALSPGGSR